MRVGREVSATVVLLLFVLSHTEWEARHTRSRKPHKPTGVFKSGHALHECSTHTFPATRRKNRGKRQRGLLRCRFRSAPKRVWSNASSSFFITRMKPSNVRISALCAPATASTGSALPLPRLFPLSPSRSASDTPHAASLAAFRPTPLPPTPTPCSLLPSLLGPTSALLPSPPPLCVLFLFSSPVR